jgi:hypothetical protein
MERVQLDVTACIFWLKNRDPEHWRDPQQLEHALGKYIISDKPMTEEQWARERADVIDVEPEKNNLAADREARDGSSLRFPRSLSVLPNNATSIIYAEIPAAQRS